MIETPHLRFEHMHLKFVSSNHIPRQKATMRLELAWTANSDTKTARDAGRGQKLAFHPLLDRSVPGTPKGVWDKPTASP